LEVAELDVEELDLVEDDWPEAVPVETVVVPEVEPGVVDTVELDTPDAVDAGVDELEDAQETALGTVIPSVSQSWSAKVIVARRLSMTETQRVQKSLITVLVLGRAGLRDTAGQHVEPAL
jgi:hypothetical protein